MYEFQKLSSNVRYHVTDGKSETATREIDETWQRWREAAEDAEDASPSAVTAPAGRFPSVTPLLLEEPALYVIIGDTDAPCPRHVCTFLPGVGFCYLDRSLRTYDGMNSRRMTPLELFGFTAVDCADGYVRFYRVSPYSQATYADGQPRAWQHPHDYFIYRKLTPETLHRERCRAP